MDYSRFRPIFHCNLSSRWVTNANEMSTNNMKSTWPTREFCVGDPTRPILHLFGLGVCVGVNANFSVCVGGNTNFWVLDTNMLASPMQNFCVGGIAQCDSPSRVFSRRSGI